MAGIHAPNPVMACRVVFLRATVCCAGEVDSAGEVYLAHVDTNTAG